MPETPLLDLRVSSTIPLFRVREPEVATTGGYTVEMQRTLLDGRATAAGRFTAPDGRVLEVCFKPSTLRLLKGQSLLADLTCDRVSLIFADGHLKPDVEADIASRLDAVISAGLVLAQDEMEPQQAWERLSRSSLNMSEETLAAYESYCVRTPRIFSKYHDAGVPPVEVPEFAGGRFRVTDSEIVNFGAFASRGWTAQQYRAFTDIWRLHSSSYYSRLPQTDWASVPCPAAALGLRRGLRPAQVSALLVSGEWHLSGVETMAALVA